MTSAATRALSPIVFAIAACGPPSQSLCNTDGDCGGLVCARDGECLPANEIVSVRITWTINGMPANASRCTPAPDLYLQFDGATLQDVFGYEPVPCMAGQFTMDKLPSRFQQVELGAVGGAFAVQAIDQANHTAMLDLTL